MISQYFATGDKDEVILGLQKLKCPFFMHEFVRRLCVAAFERCTLAQDEPLRNVVGLLRMLAKQTLLPTEMVLSSFALFC